MLISRDPRILDPLIKSQGQSGPEPNIDKIQRIVDKEIRELKRIRWEDIQKEVNMIVTGTDANCALAESGAQHNQRQRDSDLCDLRAGSGNVPF
jgi:hypothetical protein